MAGLGKLTKLVNTASKAMKTTRKSAGKLVSTVEKNGQKIETYEKQVGKYNPFRRTKKVTTRFVEGEANPTRVTVQRQKGSVFQTATSYNNGNNVTSQVNVKTGQMEYLDAAGNKISKQVRQGLDKTHTDHFTRNWAIGGITVAGAGVGYALLSNEEEYITPAAVETPEIEAEEEVAADSTETAPKDTATVASADTTAVAPPVAQADSTATDSIPAAVVPPVAPVDSTATDSIAAPAQPVAPADSTATDSIPAQHVVPGDSIPATPAVPTDSVPTRPVAPADSVPTRPTAPTDSVPATPVAPADSVPSRPAAPADSIPAQPAQPTAPQQPQAPATPAASAPTAPAAQANNIFGGTINGITTATHDVVKGDCLWNIAKQELQKANPGKTISNGQILAQVKEFIRLNPQIKNPDLIYPNQQIKMCA